MCLGVTSNKGGAILGTSNQGSLNLHWVHSPKLASFKTRGIRY
jgi:hypothetical protein